MTPAEIGLIGIAVLLIIVTLGIHVGFAMIAAAFVGIGLVRGFGPAISFMGILPFNKVNSSTWAVIPLFLLMSAFVSRGGIAAEAYDTVRAWIGHVRGGLAMATTGACGLFAAVSGSSLAGAVSMGKVAYPEMKRLNYDSKMAVGVIAAGGTLGVLIPPSIAFVIIGILTEQSIGQLFMAGIIPGILEVAFYMGTIYILCRFNPRLGPPALGTTLRRKMGVLRLTWPVGILFVTVMGGLYAGVFSPTEAGGVGAFGALVICLARRKLSRSGFADSLMETARMGAMIAVLIIGSMMFNSFLALTRIPYIASEFIVGVGLARYVVLGIILFVYIILGMFFDIYAILILTLPILFPTIVAMGFDPIWYGVLMVRICEIGMITPPFGLNLFALAGVVDVPMSTLYRGVIPFVIADLFHVGLLIAFPILCTFLPSMMW